MLLISCTITHRDVTDLINHGMVNQAFLKKEKLTTNKKNIDINIDIREMKNSMARITRNR